MGLKIKDKQFLFTGDAGIKQELALLRKYPSIKADILKLGHHGSKTSSSKELIKHLQSSYGIASSNPKIYGHPHIEVKKNLQRQHTRLLQTSIEGDIIVTFTILFDFIHTQAKGFAIM